MDLMCVSRTKINAIVTTYFISYGIAGLMLYKLPDTWGRKKTICVFGSIHTFAQFLIIFFPDYNIRLFAFALMGSC
jgi:MFS family permease